MQLPCLQSYVEIVSFIAIQATKEQEGQWQPWKFTAVYHHKDPGVIVTHLIVKLGLKLEVILLWFTCKILIFQQTDSSYWDGCFSTVEKWGAALADSPWSSVWAQSTVAGVHVCIVFEYLSAELVSFPDPPPKGGLGTRLVLSQLIWRNSWLSCWSQRASNVQCRHRFRYRQTLTCNPVATFSCIFMNTWQKIVWRCSGCKILPKTANCKFYSP